MQLSSYWCKIRTFADPGPLVDWSGPVVAVDEATAREFSAMTRAELSALAFSSLQSVLTIVFQLCEAAEGDFAPSSSRARGRCQATSQENQCAMGEKVARFRGGASGTAGCHS